MSSITYDGQSFIIDSRRIWLVSGAIHYPRVPAELWRDRIRAAKQAGLNCIETYAFWNAHEPEPGRFDFTGNLDVRRFVQTIAEEGMFCILRPGPYICAEWDFGGLPPWLLRHPNAPLRLRQSDPAFLEASARYLGALMQQVRDLQITAPTEALPAPAAGNIPGETAGGFPGGGGGPIILVQVENEWMCANDQQAETYLRELARYLRENGCDVPLTNCNNLWQRVEGTIDTWNANRRLLAELRQLGVVQDDAPRLVTEYWPGWFDTWGQRHSDALTPADNLARIARILAARAQPNLYMFHGGTNFGFTAGRTIAGPDAFITTSYDYDAPLREAGGRGEKYHATKRICTFASQFHHVLANLRPDPPHAALNPDQAGGNTSLVHLPGSQGDAIFLFRDPETDAAHPIDVLLPNGLTLPVHMGDDPAAWLLLAANLAGTAQLEYTNLRPFAFLHRRLLVLFGPPGSEGIIAIDGAERQLTVPTGREPLVEQQQGITIAVLSTEQIDAAYPALDGLVVGSAGLDRDGNPLPRPGWSRQYHIDRDGNLTTTPTRTPRKPTAPKLTGWEYASTQPLLAGEDAAFHPIEGPASLEQLQCDQGYGWYRIDLPRAKQGKVLAPHAGDRLHLFARGKPLATLGLGPGATEPPASLRLATRLVVLADNMGRFCIGHRLGEPKGLPDPLYAVEPAKLPKAELTESRSPDAFEQRGYVHCHRRGEQGAAHTLKWTIRIQGKKPLILEVRDLPMGGIFYINGQYREIYEPGPSAHRLTLTLTPDDADVRTGNNTIELALFAPLTDKLDANRYLKLYRVKETLTERAKWAFAPWGPPATDAFAAMPARSRLEPGPAWFRTTFSLRSAEVPLFLEPAGMSKGQIYLNGRNLGRYFVATADGKAVPPQRHYYLPEPWLSTSEPNELLLFDEHGKPPTRARLEHKPLGPYDNP